MNRALSLGLEEEAEEEEEEDGKWAMGLMKVKTQWATSSTPNERDKRRNGKERGSKE